MPHPTYLQTFSDQELSRALATTRNARDAYGFGREPADVLDLLTRLAREQEARRLMRRANRARMLAAPRTAERYL